MPWVAASGTGSRSGTTAGCGVRDMRVPLIETWRSDEPLTGADQVGVGADHGAVDGVEPGDVAGDGGLGGVGTRGAGDRPQRVAGTHGVATGLRARRRSAVPVGPAGPVARSGKGSPAIVAPSSGRGSAAVAGAASADEGGEPAEQEDEAAQRRRRRRGRGRPGRWPPRRARPAPRATPTARSRPSRRPPRATAGRGRTRRPRRAPVPLRARARRCRRRRCWRRPARPGRVQWRRR